MLAELRECQVLQMTSYGPQDALVTPLLPGRASSAFPAGLASLQGPRAVEDRSDGFAEQLPAQGEDVTLGATTQG